MIAALRCVVSFVVLTGWHGGRILWLSLRGVRHAPGGVYDRINHRWAVGMMRWNRVGATVEGLDQLASGQPYVYIIENGKIARRAIKLGATQQQEGLVEVLGGLERGMNVVAARVSGLKAGAPAKLKS